LIVFLDIQTKLGHGRVFSEFCVRYYKYRIKKFSYQINRSNMIRSNKLLRNAAIVKKFIVSVKFLVYLLSSPWPGFTIFLVDQNWIF